MAKLIILEELVTTLYISEIYHTLKVPIKETYLATAFVHLVSYYMALSSPDPLDALGKTNIVGLELVPTPADHENGQEVEPVANLAGLGDTPCREVVGNA